MLTMTRTLPLFALTVLLPLCGACSSHTDESADADMIEGSPLITLLEPDGIPSINAPRFVSADEARLFMTADESVLGVVGRRGTAKCYSAWQLDDHEIVNDRIDGEPIAATW